MDLIAIKNYTISAYGHFLPKRRVFEVYQTETIILHVLKQINI